MFIYKILGAAAEERVTGHFHQLNKTRRAKALRDQLFTDALSSVLHNTGNLGTGFILLLAIPLLTIGVRKILATSPARAAREAE